MFMDAYLPVTQEEWGSLPPGAASLKRKIMDKLLERYAKDQDKISMINGLLIAQALCARKLIEGHDEKILDIMGAIAATIEQIKVG